MARQRFSSTLRPRKSWLIWNVREPAPRARGLGECVMSSPSSSTRPADGLSTPVIRLTSSSCRLVGSDQAPPAPRGNLSETSRATARAPKLLLTARLKGGRRHGAASGVETPAHVLEQAEQAAPREEHGQHEQETDAELPELRAELRQSVLEQHVDGGPRSAP